MSLETRLRLVAFEWPKHDTGYRDRLFTDPSHSAKASHTTGWESWMLYLAPHSTVKGAKVCPFSTPQCRAACLFTAGRGTQQSVRAGRVRRTRLAMERPADFLSAVCAELDRLQARAVRTGKRIAVRLNGTSDICWEYILNFKLWPDLRFYDYTKWPLWQRATWDQHRLVESVDERWSDDDILTRLAAGGRLSIVSPDPVEAWAEALPDWVTVVGEDDGELPAIDGPLSMAIILAPKGDGKRQVPGGFVRRAPVSV